MLTTRRVIKSLLLLVGCGIVAEAYYVNKTVILAAILIAFLYIIYDIGDPDLKMQSVRKIRVYRILFIGICGVIVAGATLIAIMFIAKGEINASFKPLLLSAAIIIGVQSILKNYLSMPSSDIAQKPDDS